MQQKLEERRMTALVLSGGGIAGIAWEIGVLLGIQDVAHDLAADICASDIIVGTSAGATVAVKITSGLELQELYEEQCRPSTTEIEVDIDLEALTRTFSEAAAGVTDVREARRRVCEIALASATKATPEERFRAIQSRLPISTWPQRDLRITAVDAGNGELTVFTRHSGVPLLEAVAASSAVPAVWPPVSINGIHYVDGGVVSLTNADRAAGADRVLIIRTSMPPPPTAPDPLRGETSLLSPSKIAVISADFASLAAFGTNPLSPRSRMASAPEGRRVGRAAAAAVLEAWR